MVQSYTGRLPYTDEHNERLDNAEHLQAGTFGAKRVILYDSSGAEVSVGSSTGSAIVSGTKTVTTAGTAEQITATPTAIKGVWVCADILAGIIVTVGDSGVVGNASGMKGVVLPPGNPPIFLAINDLSLLYVDSQNDGGKLSYAYIT